MVWVNTKSERGPLPCNGWLCSGLIMDPANRAPRVKAGKRKTIVFKTSSRAVMNPRKNAMGPVGVIFTNCELNTSDTEKRSSEIKAKADERYNIEVTGRTG